MADTRARFGVLGPMQLTIDDVVQNLGGPKQRAALAYLVINANRHVSVDALSEAVWEGNPPPDVRVSLHAIVSNLRKPLRDAGLDARPLLAHVGAGYRVAVAEDALDVQRFRTLRDSGLRALSAGSFSAASELMTDALGQWRGQALADLRGLGFADAYAAALDDERIGVIEARAEADIAQGRAEAVVSGLTLLIDDHPLREPLWEQLITALYVSGRQSDALEAVRRVRATLADELGIDPGRPIRELEARMLRQEPLDARSVAAATAFRATTIIDRDSHVHQAFLRDPTGRRYPVNGPFTRIGRLPHNDIVLEEGKVSRHHAVIVSNGRAHVVKDLMSSNGLYVDGVRVMDSAALADGSVVRIGDTDLTFVLVPLDPPPP
ncbi:BTAD domain-containing putative transcriptional regulator [Nocardia sp. GCM10030253]|uniref:BTAD domain-containing putative transcriptional regulator n=1 Tax=Nocardia sp. GCM10030253 TaxID=3273404 RepID=UPI0036389C9F